ncbi:senecionine N-oxygenase-like isoform X1 [Leguminivora glycinivorella]|uniref:senecionine N-oxygenase-like isoform X1 n=1 Tax=Leguminivora glycinivorella TaxID=1035111 RepID=UPI00200F8F10|nr:senecionine N-oxygenase-like isoform X1 [Leguminivora glycinivorella]
MYKRLVFCGLCFVNYIMCEKIQDKITNPRVCVIGAGVAGLSSARYLKEEGINFTVLECTRYVGGTWRYDPRVGTDENGLPLHTSMYKHLRTNLPKPTMELNGYRLPDDTPSYPSWERYYKYLKDIAEHFDLEKHIKFLHLVVSVKRIDNVWKVKHKHVITGEEFNEDYDYVLIGTGHHSKPNRPVIKGEEKFKGTIIHSHDYRTPEPYAHRRVLIIGAGPSGMEISLVVAEVASRLVHSHHSPAKFDATFFPSVYVKRPDVQELNETGVVFVDGSFEEVDDVILCTGYEYDYPFLDSSSGLTFSTISVVPLYKYMVNIHEPSMVFMGLVVRACLVVAIDAQARYATALIKGNFTLPSKEEMMADWQSHVDNLLAKGRSLKDIHILADKEDAYYEDLTRESGIARVPPVLFKIRDMDMKAKIKNLFTYRNYVYTVLDNETFTRRLQDESTTSNNTVM